MIDWTAFDWPSFATLLTGLAAVIAASVVGLKQSAIAKRQSEILHRQTQLSELSLRHDLFDRRYVVYRAAVDFNRRALTVIRRDNDDESEVDLIQAMHEARFLFRPAVYEQLMAMVDRAIDLEDARSEQSQNRRTTDVEDENLRAKIRELRKALRADHAGLIDLFGPEMRLGDLSTTQRAEKPDSSR